MLIDTQEPLGYVKIEQVAGEAGRSGMGNIICSRAVAAGGCRLVENGHARTEIAVAVTFIARPSAPIE